VFVTAAYLLRELFKRRSGGLRVSLMASEQRRMRLTGLHHVT
jgi:hypothetical protein